MLVEVALPLPVPHTFTYRVEGWEEVAEGTRVLVPFGRRRLIGWVVGPGTPSIDLARVRSVSQIFDEEPGLTDGKGTRMNSSNVANSYDELCLKKKHFINVEP